MRQQIPSPLQRELLFRNEAVCCVCQKPNIQIHHIDGDHRNNKLSNLATLCIEHHAQASSKSLMTKTLSPSLIRRFKVDWESRVARKRGIYPVSRMRLEDKWEQKSIKFELKKIVYYLPSLRTKKETDIAIDKIYQWHILEGYDAYILKNIDFIRWFLSVDQIKYISVRIYELFWHLVGPKDVPMRKDYKRNLHLAIELLAKFITQLTYIDGNKLVAIRSIMSALTNLFEISISYKNEDLEKFIFRVLKEGIKEWRQSDSRERPKVVKFMEEHIKKYQRLSIKARST